MTEFIKTRRAPVAAETAAETAGEAPVVYEADEAPEEPPHRSLLSQAFTQTFRKVGARIGAVWIIFLLLISAFAPLIANSRPYLMKNDEGLSSPLLRGLADIDILLLVLLGVVGTLLVVHKFFRKLTFGIGLGVFLTVLLVGGVSLWWTELWGLADSEWFFDGALPEASEYRWSAAGVFVLLALVAVLPWLTMRTWSWRVRLGAAAALLAVLLPLAAWFAINPTNPPRLARLQQWRQDEARDKIDWAINAPISFSPNDRLADVGDSRTVPPWWSVPAKNVLGLLPYVDGASDETVADVGKVPTGHWLGTTINGEDMASRMIFSARVALAIGIIATGISTIIGIFIGAIMGYFGGIVDLLMMRLIEIMQALPVLVVLLIVTQFFGKDIWLMMVAIGLMTWTTDARFVRAEFLRLRGQDFVQAGRALGLPLRSILFRHMLPNGVAPVLVNASFGIAAAILFESILSFLGLGLEAKDPSWGQLLNQARQGGTSFNWWIAIFPGLAIFLTVFSYILIGESVRDAIDPKLKKD
ncbi:MAG: ABC transporter permease [Planctomycetota bacterium]